MTRSPADLRADIPATEDVAYFNTGASGPSPRRVVDAVCEGQAAHSYDSPGHEGMYPAAYDQFDRTREAVAGLLGASPEEIALTQSTTDGVNLIAGSLDWQPGDVVVRTDLEHPGGILPWRRLEDTHGVEVRVVESDGGYVDLDDFAAAVSDARLVCLSSLSWNYGTRLPVAAVTELAHEAGARVLVDAVQSPGQMSVDVDDWGIDFLAGAGHKWLLGPWGAGFLYVDEDALDAVTPQRVGGRSVVESTAHDYEFEPSAARLEVSTKSVASYTGLAEAVALVRDVGLGTIEDRIRTLTDRLKAGLPDDALVSPREYESGLVSFRVDDPEAFVDRVKDDDIVIRSLPYPDCVRASVHVFNTPAEIDALLAHV